MSDTSKKMQIYYIVVIYIKKKGNDLYFIGHIIQNMRGFNLQQKINKNKNRKTKIAHHCVQLARLLCADE